MIICDFVIIRRDGSGQRCSLCFAVNSNDVALDRRALRAGVTALVTGERLQLFVDRHDVHVQVTPVRTPGKMITFVNLTNIQVDSKTG